MATTPKRIQRIQGPISALNAGQIGVEDTVDADLGFKMHGGKDGAGGVTKWLAKDKPARVSEMTVQDLGAGAVVSDATGRLSTAVIPGFQDLQSVMETGSVAEIATDYELEIEQDAPLSGTANPIYVRERIRNTAPASATTKASEMRRRSEGVGGTSYSEVRQFVGESDTQRDFISEIRATDTWAATVRCRVFNGASEIIESAQTKTETIAGDRTATIEKDVLEGTVTDTESVKNIGLDATTGDVSFARKIILVESDNDTAAGLGTPGRLTLTAEASNEAGYDGDSAFSIDAFDGAVEKRVVSSGILGANTFHSIIAQSFLVNGEPQGVQFVTTVADTPHVMTIASAKKIIFEGSASNSPCELPPANSTATLSDGTVVTMRGRSFELVNASSEFIPVKNSGTASSVFDILGPGCTLTATCTGVSTAAGTWTISSTKMPESKGTDYTYDFNGYASYEWTPSNGTGASLKTTGVAFGGAQAGAVGYWMQSTGATAAPIHQATVMQPVVLYNGPTLFRHRIRLTAAPTGAEDYVFEAGLFATLNAAEAVNGIVLRAPGVASTLTTWQAVSMAASAAPTLVSSSTAVNTANIELTFVTNNGATRVDYWVNETYVGKITSNIPSTSAILYPGVKIVRTVGTADQLVMIDAARHAMVVTAGR